MSKVGKKRYSIKAIDEHPKFTLASLLWLLSYVGLYFTLCQPFYMSFINVTPENFFIATIIKVMLVATAFVTMLVSLSLAFQEFIKHAQELKEQSAKPAGQSPQS